MHCRECPHPDRLTKVGEVGAAFPGDGICVVGEAPLPYVTTKTPWGGGPGQLLDRVLEGLEIPVRWKTLALSCRPMRGEKIETMVGKCSNRLYDEIREVKPTVILTLGLAAYRAFAPKGRSILKNRGIPFFHEETGCWVMPTKSPGRCWK